MARVVYKDIAPGAAADASYTAPDKTPASNLDFNSDPAGTKYVALDTNRWLLDGEQVILYSSVHWWSGTLSGNDSTFATPPTLTIAFDENYSSLGLTLTFDSANGEFCTDLNVSWYQGSTLKASQDYTPDKVTYFCEKKVVAWNKIVVTFRKTNLPQHRLRVDRIYFGLIREFENDEIVSASIVKDIDLISAELPASQFDWQLNSKKNVDYMFQLKQPLEVYNDSSLIGVYYINQSSRLTATQYSVSAQDAIGVLGEQMFAGGAYLNGISAKTLLTNIVGGAFTIDYASVSDSTLYGILLPQTKREAIQQLIFAWGVCLRTDGNTLKVFTAPVSGTTITAANTYIGSAVQTSAIVTQVNVVGHTYTQDASGSIEIGGVKYSDTQTVYTVTNPDVSVNDIANVISVDSATLISTHNGAATATRVFNHYLRRDTHTSRIIYANQMLGDYVTQPTPWSTTTSGNIKSMTITLSGIIAADIETLGVVT